MSAASIERIASARRPCPIGSRRRSSRISAAAGSPAATGPVFGALDRLPGVHSIETRSFATLEAPTRINVGAVAATGS